MLPEHVGRDLLELKNSKHENWLEGIEEKCERVVAGHEDRSLPTFVKMGSGINSCRIEQNICTNSVELMV